MTYPKYCNKNHLFVFINQKAKKVAVASATIYFLEESTMKNAQNGFQHKIIQGEQPAGACCLISNGQTTATAQTKPVRQLSSGLGTGQYG